MTKCYSVDSESRPVRGDCHQPFTMGVRPWRRPVFRQALVLLPGDKQAGDIRQFTVIRDFPRMVQRIEQDHARATE